MPVGTDVGHVPPEVAAKRLLPRANIQPVNREIRASLGIGGRLLHFKIGLLEGI
jgi:hypothetical protein